ncbi:HP1 and insulator partner protein 1 [Cochliomyia hominivorax]
MAENSEEFTSNALVVISNEYTTTPIGLSKNASSSTINEADDAPRIICNELIVNPHKSKSLDKLDELSSLEREIAKMHHVDESNIDLDEAILSSSAHSGEQNPQQLQIIGTLTTNTSESDLSNGKNITIVGVSDAIVHDKIDAITSGETALEHEDLIAVLKGLDGNGDESHNNTGTEGVSLLEEGVTIEGEGEYQIMEVIDEDSNAPDDTAIKTEIVGPETTTNNQTLNKTKTFGSTVLTAQEERALALEQMEVLKTTHRRRKQDIKPIKQIDPALELVSALEADWSENDEDITSDNLKTESKPKAASMKTKTTTVTTSSSATSSKSTGDNKSNSPLITSVVVIPSPVITTASNSTTVTTANATAVASKNDDTSGTNNSSTDEVKITKLSPADGVIETKTEENTQVLSSQTGFRRTRIIKRKIIWDPDAPETTFSYAKLVKPNSNSKTITASITKGSTTITPIKKEAAITATQTATTKKTPRPVTPKNKKASTELNTAKANITISENTAPKKAITTTTTEKEISNPNNKSEDLSTKAETSAKLETKTTTATSTSSTTTPTATVTSNTTTPPKRRSQTPVSNGPGGSGGAKKKKISEVDRLMGDEGAVNMLNSLEKLEATLGSGDAKSTRPMMRSRAATISEKLPRKDTTSPNRTTPPAAAATATNQQQSTKGKRTPKSRASSSWDYVYKKTKKQEDFDDSLIIRRRSNSSYSSTTSLNRLSLDGPPSSIANDTKPLPASSSENDLSKTPPATSSHNKSAGSLKTRTTPLAAGSSKSFEFAKPENKKSQKRTKSPAATLTNDMKKAAPVAGGRRNARSPATTTSKEDNVNKDKETSKNAATKSPTASAKEKKDAKETSAPSTNIISDVVVKKSAKVAQILFSTNKAKLSNTFTIQMLNKLVDILDKLALDPDCHAVVIGTNDAHFCQGIDLTDLTTIAAEKRKNYAVTLATSVKNYLKTLATFPKPLIGGVTGNLVNLGVIQLALFDVVIASDKTTFETPYAKMGQAPEGYCIWYNMNKIRGSFKTKLFWLGERIQSTEAALAGLVNKLTAANKVNDDAFAAAKRIASLSVESYRVMKKTAINNHLDVIVNSMDEEFDTIIKQWTSNECLENIKKYLGHD